MPSTLPKKMVRDLNAAGLLTNADLLLIEQNGYARKLTLTILAAAIAARIAPADIGAEPAGAAAAAVTALINGAGPALDTLKELADALGNDADFAATITNQLAAQKAVTAVASVAGVATFDLAIGNYFTLALAEDITSITFANLPGAGNGGTIMIRITQDAIARTVAWPASFKWEGGTPESVSTAAGAVDILAITTFDNGTTWHATLSKGRA